MDVLGTTNLKVDDELIEKEKQMIERIKSGFKDMQQHTQFNKEAQLESLGLNLKNYEYFPSNTIFKGNRSIDGLYALAVNMRKKLNQDKDENLVNVFLSNNGISLSKVDKDVMELSKNIQTRYDLTADVVTMDKYFFKDQDKFSELILNYSIRKNINSVWSKNEKRKKTEGAKLLYYEEMTNLQVKEIQKFTAHQGKTNLAEDVKTSSKISSNITPVKKKYETTYHHKPSLSSYKRSGVESDVSLVLFDKYFDCMKSYFYFKCKGEVLRDKVGFLFSQSQIEKFKPKEDLPVIPIAICLNDLTSNFRQDKTRRSLSSLILTQISKEYEGLSVNQLLINTTKFYENEFLIKAVSLEREVSSVEELTELRSQTKVKAIESYLYSLTFGKFNSHPDLEELNAWGKVYYMLRAGMISELKGYLTDTKTCYPELKTFERAYLDYDPDAYNLIMESISIKSEKETNPFRHACFILATKTSQNINEEILEDMSDYIWFHMQLIVHNDKVQRLKEISSFRSKTLTLKEFQDYVLRAGPSSFVSNSIDFKLDYMRCLFSLLLYEEGIKSISESYIVDATNYSFILNQVGLLKNFNHVNVIIKKEDDSADYIMSELIINMTSNFLTSRFNQILCYVRYSSRFVEKLSTVISNTSNYSCLTETTEPIFTINGKDVTLGHMLNEEELREIVSNVIHNSLTNESNYEQLVTLAKRYKMYRDLLELMARDAIVVLNSKLPKEIHNPNVHESYKGKPNQGSNLIRERLKSFNIVDELDQFDSLFRANYKRIRQFETIEDIYDLISSQSYDQAFDMFVKYLSLVPYKNEKEIEHFVNKDIDTYNKQVKRYLPEVIYLIFYLLSLKLKAMKSQITSRKE